MKLKVGRFGVDFLSGEVRSVGDDGTEVKISGVTAYADRAAAVTLRQQLLGYVNSPDESFVPVLWDEQPELNGFYRVTGGSVTESDGSAWEGLWNFSVSLERVTGFAAPLIEVQGLGATRTADAELVSAYSPRDVFCFPAGSRSVAAFAYLTETWTPRDAEYVRESATGDVLVYDESATGFLYQYYVDPDLFYGGAASLLMGPDLAVAVGRQVRNLPDAWRLSNGLFEIEPVPGETFKLQQRMWLDGEWTAWAVFTLWSGTTGGAPQEPMLAPHSMAVLRNSPTEVAVRLLGTASGYLSPVTVDLSLKRGRRWVSVELRSVFNSRFQVECKVPPSNADVLATQSEDWVVYGPVSDGSRVAVASPWELNITSGRVHPYEDAVTSVDSWSMMWGTFEGAAGSDNMGWGIREWLFAGSQRQAVVVQ